MPASGLGQHPDDVDPAGPGYLLELFTAHVEACPNGHGSSPLSAGMGSTESGVVGL